MNFNYDIITRADICNGYILNISQTVEPKGIAKILGIKPKAESMGYIERIIKKHNQFLSNELQNVPLFDGGRYELITSFSKENPRHINARHIGAAQYLTSPHL